MEQLSGKTFIYCLLQINALEIWDSGAVQKDQVEAGPVVIIIPVVTVTITPNTWLLL